MHETIIHPAIEALESPAFTAEIRIMTPKLQIFLGIDIAKGSDQRWSLIAK